MTIVLHKKIVKKASKMAVLWPIKVTSGPLKKYVWRAEWLSTLHTVQPGENRPLATNFISMNQTIDLQAKDVKFMHKLCNGWMVRGPFTNYVDKNFPIIDSLPTPC